MLQVHSIINFIAAGLGFGIFLLFILASYYTQDKKNERITYLSFSFFCLTITTFVFAQAMIYNSVSFDEGLFWHRFQHVGAVWIPSTFIHFSYAITRSNTRKLIVSFSYFISLTFLFVTYSDLFILPISNLNASIGFEGGPGPIYNIFTLFILYGIIVGEYTLIMGLINTNDHSLKRQLKYIITSTGILAMTGILDLMMLFGVISGFSFSEVGVIFFCLSIAAIIGVDIQYFKDKSEYHEKRVIIDRLDTTRHVASLFLHDIRHIVASFKLYLYHNKTGKLKDPEEKYTRLMERFRRCEGFLKDVLSPEFTDYLFESVDLVPFIDRVVDDFIFIQTKNIIVAKNYPDDRIIMDIDKEKFERVIYVILTNAYDAMEEDGRIDISIKKHKDVINIRIKDTGLGMTEEQMQTIGRPRVSSKGEKGEGLGLFTSISVIQRHKGTMKIESKKGEGSMFTIELPVHKRAEAAYPFAERIEENKIQCL